VATSRRGGLAAYLESTRNLAGCAGGLVGLVLHFTGLAGSLWPVVVAGLYGVGALLAPPPRPPLPRFPTADEQVAAVRADLAALNAYLAGVRLPAGVSEPVSRLLDVVAGLVDPGLAGPELAQDGERLHAVSRIVRQDLPEAVDGYARARWWHRLAPGDRGPEVQLSRQVELLTAEATAVASDLREAEERRRETQTRYLEERGRDL
jgi:hypothetical protein